MAKWIKITMSNTLYRFRVDEIVIIKSDGNYSIIKLFNGDEETVTMQLGKLKEALITVKDSPFIRIGRKYIINKDFIRKIDLTAKKCILSGRAIQEVILEEVPRNVLLNLKEYINNEKQYTDIPNMEDEDLLTENPDMPA